MQKGHSVNINAATASDQKLPEAITNMAMAGTVYNAQNAVGPYNAAQYGRQYFT